VVVNGSGNGILGITWTQGKKGARSTSEIDQAPGAPLCLVLTVYFGTPNRFITLLFGFDHGTNPPLGTLII
jgi:hypothetical protein